MDAREVNQFFAPPKFELPNVLNVMARKGAKHYCKIDLSDAYMHVRFTKDFSRWFTFDYQGKKFAWQHMGFGWNMAPHVFQTLADALCKHIKQTYQVDALVYYDDMLLFSTDEDSLKKVFSLIAADIINYGFQINEKKCVSEPQSAITWLGFELSGQGVSYSKSFLKKIALQT